MSNDKDLIRCPVKEEYEALLAQPTNQAIKNLKFKNSTLVQKAEKLKEKVKSLQESNEKLRQLPEELKAELKGIKALAELEASKLREIRQWLTDHNHPQNKGESIIEKLDNMQAIIDGNAGIVEVLNQVMAKHPEVKRYFKEHFDKKQKKAKKGNPLGLAAKIGEL